jgi:hypothetical protein
MMPADKTGANQDKVFRSVFDCQFPQFLICDSEIDSPSTDQCIRVVVCCTVRYTQNF